MRTQTFFKFLVLVAVVSIAAGCASEVRRLQGANQELVRQRDTLTKEIEDLKAQLAGGGQDAADVEARLQKAQDDADYWKGQAEAFKEAYEKRAAMGEGLSEKIFSELAAKYGWEPLPGGGVRIGSEFLFDSGKATLKVMAKQALAEAATALQSSDVAQVHLRIDGHTDNVPIKYSKWKDNMELSQARSRAVWVELKNRGVSPGRMFTAGFGEFGPIASNASAEGRIANRRVEIWLVPAPGATVAASSPAVVEEAPIPTKED